MDQPQHNMHKYKYSYTVGETTIKGDINASHFDHARWQLEDIINKESNPTRRCNSFQIEKLQLTEDPEVKHVAKLSMRARVIMRLMQMDVMIAVIIAIVILIILRSVN